MKLKGDALRDARDRKGLTQEDLADELQMAIATIVKAENGGDIHIPTGREICNFLGIDLAKVVIPRIADTEKERATKRKVRR